MHRRSILIVLSILVALAAAAAVATAGDPDNPPGPPDQTASYTLDDIYNRLSSGAAGTPITFTEPVSGPTVGTMHTLDQIMDAAPELDAGDGAVAAEVLGGATFWGLTAGQWGPAVGTMPDNGAVTLVPTTTAQAIPAGYHNGSGVVTGDSDLEPENIRAGESIFGVQGALYAPLRKTGQLATHAAGDDGTYQMGVAWPNPRFVDNGDGTITDRLTGLIWLQNANCYGRVIWSSAITAANSLADGACGLTDGSSAADWRLPNGEEMHSLVDYRFVAPAISDTAGTGHWSAGDPFNNVQSDGYWASSTMAGSADYAWCVPMGDGTLRGYTKATTYYVWPVRGGE